MAWLGLTFRYVVARFRVHAGCTCMCGLVSVVHLRTLLLDESEFEVCLCVRASTIVVFTPRFDFETKPPRAVR